MDSFSLSPCTINMFTVVIINFTEMTPPIFKHYSQPTGTTTGHFKLTCKHCSKSVSGSYTSTSNFHTHIKVRLRNRNLF